MGDETKKSDSIPNRIKRVRPLRTRSALGGPILAELVLIDYRDVRPIGTNPLLSEERRARDLNNSRSINCHRPYPNRQELSFYRSQLQIIRFKYSERQTCFPASPDTWACYRLHYSGISPAIPPNVIPVIPLSVDLNINHVPPRYSAMSVFPSPS